MSVKLFIFPQKIIKNNKYKEYEENQSLFNISAYGTMFLFSLCR